MNASISSFLYGILSPLVLASAGPEQKPDDQKDASANPAYSPVLQCLPQVEMVNPPKPGVLQDAREQWLLDNWLTGKDYSFDSLNADIVAINSGKGTLQIVYKMSPDGKKIEKAVVYLIQNQPIPGCPQQERVEAQELALWDKKQEIASWEAGKAPDKSVPLVAYLQEILRPFGLLPGEYKPGVMDAATINALQNMVYSRASALPEDPKLPLMILREKRAEMHAKTGRLERYEAGKEPGHDHQ
ncbi:MAG: hypothetical protein NT099_01255, partial [Candidatus Saganbacteria bacterium]|nr:hypothetical protein [Candidatus Saganbacteria bacterium]